MSNVMLQKIPIIQTCCCGCSLYDGTLIITIWDLVAAIGQFVHSCAVASAIQIVRDEIANGNVADVTDEDKDLIGGLYGLFVFFAFLFLGVIVISSMAIHGARTASPSLLLPWLYAFVVREVINIVVAITMLAKANDYTQAIDMNIDGSSTSVAGYTSDQLDISLTVQAVYTMLNFALWLYFFLVIYSFYLELQNRRIPQPGYPAGSGGLPAAGNPTIIVPSGANVVYAAGSPVAVGYDSASGTSFKTQAPTPYLG